MILLGPRKGRHRQARVQRGVRRGLLVFDGPAALAMFLECIRDVGEWVREG